MQATQSPRWPTRQDFKTYRISHAVSSRSLVALPRTTGPLKKHALRRAAREVWSRTGPEQRFRRHRTRTRTEAAGTACSASARLAREEETLALTNLHLQPRQHLLDDLVAARAQEREHLRDRRVDVLA